MDGLALESRVAGGTFAPPRRGARFAIITTIDSAARTRELLVDLAVSGYEAEQISSGAHTQWEMHQSRRDIDARDLAIGTLAEAIELRRSEI
jgi:hypothetical protein